MLCFIIILCKMLIAIHHSLLITVFCTYWMTSQNLLCSRHQCLHWWGKANSIFFTLFSDSVYPPCPLASPGGECSRACVCSVLSVHTQCLAAVCYHPLWGSPGWSCLCQHFLQHQRRGQTISIWGSDAKGGFHHKIYIDLHLSEGTKYLMVGW